MRRNKWKREVEREHFAYSPGEISQNVVQNLGDSKYFNWVKWKREGKIYSMVIPHPNVTGILLGHE